MSESQIIEFLSQYITDHKKELIDAALNERTYFITTVLEDIYQPHNASAVLRTCDSLGIQDVHVIENRNPYEVNPDVALGSSKWISLNKYHGGENNTRDCLATLKEKGYQIICTSPDPGYPDLNEFKMDKPTAFVFGTEMEGISKDAIAMADGMLRIPMYGFTESYNISVSAAICLYTMVQRMRSSGVDWNLSGEEKNVLRLQWYRKIVRNHKALEREFMERNQ